MSDEVGIEQVRSQYAGVAKSNLSNDSTAVRAVASAFGYSEADLASLPQESNMGLSCGNPLAMASVTEGEIVLDLGCGGGMDVFLTVRKVGERGKAIGVDMTSEMLGRARTAQQRLGLTNVKFYQATIDNLPLPDNSIDCVISNCVINLVPDKPAVFREIYRVLAPGGRLAISDIALKQALPVHVKESVEAYVGCISGALLIDTYRSLLEEARFQSVVVQDTGADLNAYSQAGSGCCSADDENEMGNQNPSGTGCCGASEQPAEPSLHDGLAAIMRSFDANAYAASVRVHAVKSGFASQSNEQTTSTTSTSTQEETSMKTVQVYDKPMCCSTGICGPEVDPALPRFAADLDWLKSQGHTVERLNLAQNPADFAGNETVKKLLAAEGVECLPLVFVNGSVVSKQIYPTRDQFVDWTGGAAQAPKSSSLPVAGDHGNCCGGSGCC